MIAELWRRIGDNAEYESAGQDFDALAGALVDAGIRSIDLWRGGEGFEAGGFCGHNYVSLYWGDKDAQMMRGLTADEQREVEWALERELVV